MPTETAIKSLPAFVQAIENPGNDAKPLDILELEHPEYTIRKRSWEVLLDAYEGAGGFLDGSYLWAFPKEDGSDYEARQAQARYHNYLETLVDLYVRFMFTRSPERKCDNQEYLAWVENVDGQKTSLDMLLKQLSSVALVHGHAGCLVDKTADEPMGPSKADETARVIASVFTAIAIPDWRHDTNGLAAVKLLEAAAPPSIAEEMPVDEDAQQFLLWDREGWARFSGRGELIGADTPMLALVPLVVLKPKPSYLSKMLGRALVSNANVIRALFNRASEEDLVLKTQAFSTLSIEVPTDGNPDQVKTDLGNTVGTSKALVVRGKINYITPDQTVATGIRENIAYLTREIYRAAHVRFHNDTLARQSGESIKQENTELNEMLQGFSKSLSQAETEIFRAWCAWTAPKLATPQATAAAAEALFEQGQFEAIYPDEFFLDDLATDLEAWAEAMRMDLGETMTRRIKKKVVMRIEPEMEAQEREQVFQEIDEQEIVSPTDMARAELQAMQTPDNGDPEGQGIKKAQGE